METTITSRLIVQIADICHINSSALSRDTRIDDIGLDSLSVPIILNALENEFGIEFNPDEVVTFLEARSIGTYADLLVAALNR